MAILASLSFPLPVAARFFAKRLAIGGPLAFRWCAHGARTAKLLRTWHVRSIGFPVACPLAVSRFASGGPLAPRPCGQRRAACAMARWPKTGHWLCLWLSAQPFCRARPVRAPLASECLRAWQALRKEARGAAPGMCEALAFQRPPPLAGGPATFQWQSLRAARPLESGIPCGRPVRWKAANPTAEIFYFFAKGLATNALKYATILTTERRIVPSNGRGYTSPM